MAGDAFRTTTLKPTIDRAIAAEGHAVVLWGDADEAVILRFDDGQWCITRHPAIENNGGIAWQGVRYAAAGERMRIIDAGVADEGWRLYYNDLFETQQIRVRNRLHSMNAPEGHATA